MIVDADRKKKAIREQPRLTPPVHGPDVPPARLAGLNVEAVIAGGMGHRAQQLFAQNGSEVLCSAAAATPDQWVSTISKTGLFSARMPATVEMW